MKTQKSKVGRSDEAQFLGSGSCAGGAQGGNALRRLQPLVGRTRVAAVLAWLLAAGCVADAQMGLQDYIDHALQSSVAINQNTAIAKQNLLENARQKAAILQPQVSVIGNLNLSPVVVHDNGRTTFQPNPENPSNYLGYDLAASNGGMYQGLVNVNQQLWNAKRKAVFDAQTMAANASLENASALTMHDVAKVVTDQYILCLLDQEQLAFADSMLALMAEQIALTRKLVLSSILKPSDLALLNIEQQGFMGQRSLARTTLRRDLQDLNLLASLEDTNLAVLPAIALQLGETVTASHYLSRFALDSASAVLSQRSFELKYKPVVSAYANGGLNAVYAPTLPRRLGVSAGLSLAWTLYDGKQKGMNQEKTQVQLDAIAFARANLQQELNIRRWKTLQELQGYEERIQIATAQLQGYAELLEDYRREIVVGQLSAINYVATLKNMMLAKRDLMLLETNRNLLINAYNYWNW